MSCGGAQVQSKRPEVIIDRSSLMLIEGSDIIPIDIHFEFDSAVLDKASFTVLDSIAQFLNTEEGIQIVEVQGHADERGTPDHNLELSRRRADAVVEYLVSRGVDKARLRAKGFGATRPVVEGESEAAFRRNRRVEFIVVESQEPTTKTPNPA